MFRSISWLVVTWLASLAGVSIAPAAFARAAVQGGTLFQQLKFFGGPPIGDLPRAGFIQGTDGALYGTAAAGGSNGNGTVFKLSADGTSFTVLQELDQSTTGSNSNSKLMQGIDGVLYGTTSWGGSGGYGTVFKLNPDGTSFTVLKSFDYWTTGGILISGLIQGKDGALYGTASLGGSSGYGTLFKLNTDGTGFTILQNFDNSTTGGWIVAGLLQGSDGALYGTAGNGGRYGGVNGYGTLFKLNTDGTGFTVLLNFDGATTGAIPYSSLIQGTDGALYGTAMEGGTHGGSSGFGTLFKLNLDGTGFTVLKNLYKSGGTNPYGELMQGTDGALYGGSSAGGSNDFGTVFRINPDGTGFRVLENLDNYTTGGTPVAGLMQGTDGALYGTASVGGNIGYGTAFKLNVDGTGFIVLKNFDANSPDVSGTGGWITSGLMRGTDGALYGTASDISFAGYYGTVFRLNPDGTSFTVIKNFDNSTSGGTPVAGLLQGTDGALYGTASVGGSLGFGTAFKLNMDGTGFAVLLNFDNTMTGGTPTGRLIQGTDGAFYGTASIGGSRGGGTVFKFGMDGSGFTVLANLDWNTTGGDLQAGLLQGTDGALYGTAVSGGNGGHGAGTIFRLNPDGTGFAVLINFDYYNSGGYVVGGLIQGTDGALYGTASQGGGSDYGTVFKLKPDGSGFTVLQDFDYYTTGGYVDAGLMQGMDGALYGAAGGGGSGGYGTLFKLNSDGTGFSVLENLDFSTTGDDPEAELLQDPNGVIYGTASRGGDFSAGTIFRLILDCSASWSNYGVGLAGTNGIPNFTASANPVLGTTISLTVDNSFGSDTAAFLIAGLNRASIPFKRGTVLVDPFRDWLVVLPLSLSAAGLSVDSAIPNDESLCGLHVALQVLEIDSGAAEGVSLTPGLELVLGD